MYSVILAALILLERFNSILEVIVDLKTFVKEAVINIVRATEEVSEELSREVRLHRKDYENIQFDVAVTVEDCKSKSGGLQILQVLSGDISNETKNSTVSRISFSLLVSSQTDAEREKL